MGDLEAALAQTEGDARATQRAAEAAAKAAKRIVAAAVTGEIAALAKALTDTEQASAALSMQLRNTRDGWSFDAKSYSEAGGLADELRAAATGVGLEIYEQDGRLFCYPALLKILASEPAVEIDRKRFRSVRPSYVVNRLKVLRNRPQRFKPEQFLELLFRAYEWARRAESGESRRLGGQGPVIELVSLFELLTLFPETAKDYGRAEFTRDLYLLDRSQVVETKNAMKVAFSAATSTKGAASKLLQIVGEDGGAQTYFGISFSAANR